MDPVVLHVLEALEGGTARHVADLTRYVDGVTHEVAIPRHRIGGVTDEFAAVVMAEAGATVHVVDMRRAPIHPVNAVALSHLRRLVIRRRPNIVHAHSSMGGVLGRLAALGRPAARVYTAHALAAGRGPLLVERVLGRVTDRWVAVSASEAELARRYGLADPNRLVVIPNGIELTVPATSGRGLRALVDIPPGVPLVGTVARLVPQKAPVDFVRVCAAVARTRPDAWFLLVGSGRLHDDVMAAAATFGVAPRLRLVDSIPAAGALLGELDVFVLTSLFEGAPYTPLEAMRAGVPVVMTDVVGSRDVVESGRSGELCPVGDIGALAHAVTMLLADPARRSSMVAAARERLTQRFDVRLMADAVRAMYLDVAVR